MTSVVSIRTVAFNAARVWLPGCIRAWAFCLALISFAPCAVVRADGGVVLLCKQSGPYTVTVFATPAPLQAGQVDLSVMVQNTENATPLLDGRVLLKLSKGDQLSINAEARHELAQNRLLYAALVDIPEPGEWKMDVTFFRGLESATVQSSMTVMAANSFLLSHWRNLAFPPLVIALFCLQQWLKRRNRQSRQPLYQIGLETHPRAAASASGK
jgi:hypothetical protein